jgi:hypothetical protein
MAPTYCYIAPLVELSFKVNGEWKLYERKSVVMSNGSVTVSVGLIYEEYFEDFLNSSEVAIRVRENNCNTIRFRCTMNGSTNAYNYVNQEE